MSQIKLLHLNSEQWNRIGSPTKKCYETIYNDAVEAYLEVQVAEKFHKELLKEAAVLLPQEIELFDEDEVLVNLKKMQIDCNYFETNTIKKLKRLCQAQQSIFTKVNDAIQIKLQQLALDDMH